MAVKEAADWSCACRPSEESKEAEEESPALTYKSCSPDAPKQPETAREGPACQRN